MPTHPLSSQSVGDVILKVTKHTTPKTMEESTSRSLSYPQQGVTKHKLLIIMPSNYIIVYQNVFGYSLVSTQRR